MGPTQRDRFLAAWRASRARTVVGGDAEALLLLARLSYGASRVAAGEPLAALGEFETELGMLAAHLAARQLRLGDFIAIAAAARQALEAEGWQGGTEGVEGFWEWVTSVMCEAVARNELAALTERHMVRLGEMSPIVDLGERGLALILLAELTSTAVEATLARLLMAVVRHGAGCCIIDGSRCDAGTWAATEARLPTLVSHPQMRHTKVIVCVPGGNAAPVGADAGMQGWSEASTFGEALRRADRGVTQA